MDIGKEKKKVIVEPLTSPVPRKAPASPPQQPVKPEREKVGA
jgi:hypothetical protein